MTVIETQNLTKSYGSKRGILNVNLKVQTGEIYGFIGPNGAGKSTTIRTLLSLIRKTSGEAKMFELDCEKDRERILEQVGYLPSEVFYYENMKARDLLDYSASFYKRDCTEKMKFLCDALEVELDKRLEDMSLGNRKKVGIVQGLMHSPLLLILDEPTTGLDPIMQKTFFEIIREENKNGAAIFFSSHILSEVAQLCSRVSIIKEGRLIETKYVHEMKYGNVRRINAVSKETGAFIGFEVPGMAQRQQNGKELTFLYNGNINALLSQICLIPLQGIEITEPPLEEIFMQYYNG